MISHETSVDGRQFAEYLAAHPIDVLKITPSHLGALLDAAGPERRVLPRRVLITGGEASTWELWPNPRGGVPAPQSLRPDRNDHRLAHVRPCRRQRSVRRRFGHGADWTAARQHRGPHRRRAARARPRGSARRTVDWRRGAVARLRRPGRTDGRPLHQEPVFDGPRGAPLPHGRPGAVPRRWQHRVRRPRRSPGEDPRVPRRARGDRGGSCAGTRASGRPSWSSAQDTPGDKRLVAYVVPSGGRPPVESSRDAASGIFPTT